MMYTTSLYNVYHCISSSYTTDDMNRILYEDITFKKMIVDY